MKDRVKIIRLVVRLDKDSFTGNIYKYPKSIMSKKWITLVEETKLRPAYCRIETSSLLTPRYYGFRSHDKISYLIDCLEKDKKKAFKMLIKTVKEEFKKIESGYLKMKKQIKMYKG